MQQAPVPINDQTATGVCIMVRRVLHFPDVDHDETVPALTREGVKIAGAKAAVFAPMLWEGKGIGSISVGRDRVGPFSDKEIALLKTFADQAVIAIQNARLFNETKEALDQQRASAEVLSAISSSIADTKPVFDKILESCERLFAGKVVTINLVGDDGLIRVGAYHGPNPDEFASVFPTSVDAQTGTGAAIIRRSIVHFPDIEHGEGVPEITRRAAKTTGTKAIVFAPMLWEGAGIGAICLGRDYVGPFSDKEIALLKTFADQAVIAIQNARLFNETNEALEQQRASGEVLAAISSSIADTTPVFDRILASSERLFAGKLVQINLVGDDGIVRLGAYYGPGREEMARLFPFPLDETSATGLAILRRTTLHFADVEHDTDVPPLARRGWKLMNLKSLIGAPMMWEGKGIGAIFVGRDYAGPFSEKEIALLKTFADQAVIAIQNARLFREIGDKSRQLEVANKHKSEFLANMSHELRTPLNAIIGFSEVLLERMFGELNEKQDDYLKDIHSSGRHLLSLINDILDLSKIEAGRMELEPSTFELAAALSNAMTLVRERAQRHSIVLGQQVDAKLGEIVADERKFKQILLNLLSNAVKFTPDGGRIDVIARHEDGAAVISVHDTGIGIAPEDQAAVFEEFRQVGRDYTNKQEGTGLGLTLTKKFVELHGGRIWLESEPGKGSTFTFTIPASREQIS
jgi:signal transduction histidine kinase